jgi:quaternary ammonium compound-resistance protein SugE
MNASVCPLSDTSLGHEKGEGMNWAILAMIISLGLLGFAMKTLPVGTAYSVWVGVGAIGTVILGIVLLGEPMSTARLISVALILAGIVALKLSTA